MSWQALEVELPRRAIKGVSAALFALGASGVQEDHLPGEAPPPRQPWDTGPLARPTVRVLLRAWLEDPDRAAVASRLEALLGAGLEVRWSDVPDTDWDAVWREGFTPIRISERLVVAPPWDAPDGALIIEPGQGFGTGHHPTTLAALRALDALADGARTALDVGCGSGVLAIAAVRLGLQASGIDVDEGAVRDARAQAARNGVEVPFSTTPVAEVRAQADIVLANLYAEVLRELSADLVRLTGAHLVLAGVLADREGIVREAFDPHLRLQERTVDGEWVSLVYAR